MNWNRKIKNLSVPFFCLKFQVVNKYLTRQLIVEIKKSQ